jgi:hypothetical protein
MTSLNSHRQTGEGLQIIVWKKELQQSWPAKTHLYSCQIPAEMQLGVMLFKAAVVYPQKSVLV